MSEFAKRMTGLLHSHYCHYMRFWCHVVLDCRWWERLDPSGLVKS